MTAADPPELAARRAAIFWAIGALAAVLVAALWLAAQPLLLVFAGVLFGTGLRGVAERCAGWLGWRVRWGLALCLVALLLLAIGAAVWIVPNVVEQGDVLVDRIAEAYGAIRRSASGSGGVSGLGERLLAGSASVGEQLGRYAMQAAGLLASTVGSLGAILFVLFVALYVAGSPGPYRRGVIRLVPRGRRDRAAAVLDALAATLRRWLLARLVSMTAVGAATAIGLWLLGIPLPVTLGLLAGLLGFVPNIGPIVSAVPAALLAFTVSPMHAGYVLILYLGINLGDGYGLTPWLQQRAVAVPPALVLSGQVVAGALWGVLGVMLATPLLACLLVLVRELYVEDFLERAPRESGQPS